MDSSKRIPWGVYFRLFFRLCERKSNLLYTTSINSSPPLELVLIFEAVVKLIISNYPGNFVFSPLEPWTAHWNNSSFCSDIGACFISSREICKHSSGPLIVLGEGRLKSGQRCPGGPEGRLFQADILGKQARLNKHRNPDTKGVRAEIQNYRSIPELYWSI